MSVAALQTIGDRETGVNKDSHLAVPPPFKMEYLRAWLKRHALANYCPANLGELHTNARNKLKSAPRSSPLLGCSLLFGRVMIYIKLNNATLQLNAQQLILLSANSSFTRR